MSVIGLAGKTPANTFVVTNSGGSYTLPVPKTKIGYTKEDLQLEAWRDEAGYLHKVEARRQLRRIDLEWSYLSDSEMQLITNALKSDEYFSFRYYDYTSGTSSTILEAYSGTITYSLYSLREGEGEWVDVKVAIIER